MTAAKLVVEFSNLIPVFIAMRSYERRSLSDPTPIVKSRNQEADKCE